jgi:hypothetical protein
VTTGNQTVFLAQVGRLREQAKRFNPAREAAPVAIPWTDEKLACETVLPKIRETLPQLLSLDAYAPNDRTGPSVWLRMVADGHAEELETGQITDSTSQTTAPQHPLPLVAIHIIKTRPASGNRLP